jgi:predicted ester cyclase
MDHGDARPDALFSRARLVVDERVLVLDGVRQQLVGGGHVVADEDQFEEATDDGLVLCDRHGRPPADGATRFSLSFLTRIFLSRDRLGVAINGRVMMRRAVYLAMMVVTVAAGLVGGATSQVVAQVATPAACPSTTPEQNKELVRRYVDEVYNAHNPAAVDQFLADDFNRNNPSRPHNNEFGLADDEARVERSLKEFPDLSSTIDDIIAEGDQVMVLQRIRGTNEGNIADLGAAATDRPAEWQSVAIWRIACGKLAENWVVTDRLTEYRQLGIISDDELATEGTPTVATPVP